MMASVKAEEVKAQRQTSELIGKHRERDDSC